MRGRTAFSASEIQRIEVALRDCARVEPSRRRRLLDTLRHRYRFYVSDYARRGGRLTPDDFERLIAQGIIRVHA